MAARLKDLQDAFDAVTTAFIFAKPTALPSVPMEDAKGKGKENVPIKEGDQSDQELEDRRKNFNDLYERISQSNEEIEVRRRQFEVLPDIPYTNFTVIYEQINPTPQVVAKIEIPIGVNKKKQPAAGDIFDQLICDIIYQVTRPGAINKIMMPSDWNRQGVFVRFEKDDMTPASMWSEDKQIKDDAELERLMRIILERREKGWMGDAFVMKFEKVD